MSKKRKKTLKALKTPQQTKQNNTRQQRHQTKTNMNDQRQCCTSSVWYTLCSVRPTRAAGPIPQHKRDRQNMTLYRDCRMKANSTVTNTRART